MDGSYLNLRYTLIVRLADPSWQFHFLGVIFHHETKAWMETQLVKAFKDEAVYVNIILVLSKLLFRLFFGVYFFIV